MGKVYSLIFSTFFLCSMLLSGQSFTVTNFTTTQGLPNNNIKKVAADNAGNIWFGSTSGLTKYNGSTWTTYTTSNGLPHNTVNGIHVAQNGDILIATDNGLSRYNGTTFVNSLNGVTIRCVFEAANNNIWVGTTSGVRRYTTLWTTYTTADGIPHNFVNTITQDLSGNIWIGTSEGVGEFDGSTWASHININGVNIDADQIISSACDLNGIVWFGSKPSMGIGGGVTSFDGTSWAHYNTAEGLAGKQVEHIAVDHMNRKWFATFSNGASLYKDHNFPQYTFQTVSSTGGLISNNCQGVSVAPSGHIWIATILGVSRVTPLKINSINGIDGTCATNLLGSVVVDAVGLSTLYYSIDGGTNFQTSGTFTNLSPGSYSVIVTDSSYSETTGSASFSTLSPIEPGIPSSLQACSSDSTQVTVTNQGSNYHWTPEAFFSNPFIYNPKMTVPTTQWVYLTMEDANGCEVEDSIYVTVLESTPMTINVNSNVFTCIGDFVSWQWTLYFVDIPGAFTNVYAATQPGVYGCIATDAQGCETNSGMIHYLNAGIDEPVNDYSFNIIQEDAHVVIQLNTNYLISDFNKLRIIGINGNNVYETTFTRSAPEVYTAQINSSAMAAGIYMIYIEGTDFNGKFSIVK